MHAPGIGDVSLMEEEEEVAGAALLLGARPAERADPVEAEIIVMEATGQQADKGAEVASSSATAAGAATKVPVVPSVSFSLGAEEKPPTLKSATARAQGVQEAGGKAAAEGGGGRQRTHRAPALKLNMPPIDPKHFGNGGGGGGGSCNCDPAATSTNVSSTCGSTTAPVFQNDRVRFFSFSSARRSHQHHPLSLDEEAGGGGGGSRLATAAVTAIPPRVRYLRQNTVGSGTNEATNRREMPQLLTRAISRTYTMTSNASSSIGVDEWKSIFDKLDLESDGRADGHIPLGKFREILEDDPLWVEAVPKEVQEQILGHADQNGDGLIDYEEFIDLVRGTHIGLSSRKRRAVRELLKQTVEFIVPYKYSYQNQYSCSPPPLFMLTMSLLQVAIFAYDGAVMFQEIGYIGLNGPVPYCSHLIYDPNKREQVWRYLTYMFIHSGLFHVTFNILIQLVLGIPLEMVHGKKVENKYIIYSRDDLHTVILYLKKIIITTPQHFELQNYSQLLYYTTM